MTGSKNIDKVRQLEAIIDRDYEILEIFQVRRHEALIMAFQIYETYIQLLENLRIDDKKNKFEIVIRERVFDCQQAIDLLVRWILKKCPETGIIPDDNFDSFGVADRAFAKAIEHNNAENFFMPLKQDIFVADVEKDNDGNEYLKFRYSSEKVAYYEAVNERLLSEYSAYKAKKRKIANSCIKKLYAGALEAIYSWMGIINVEIEFELPDTYRIGPYTVGQIKEIWYKVIRSAYFGDRTNREEARGITQENARMMNLSKLVWDQWNFEVVDKQTTERLVDDLTFTGKRKGKQQFSSLLTEPILEMEDGTKFLSPRFILQYPSGRNIISALNRIYGDDASVDADQKEVIFTQEIQETTEKYSNLRFAATTALGHGFPDVDVALYDNKSKTLLALELKWLTEPATTAEIVSKDKEIKKAITVQLPNYVKGITEDSESFTRKAFGEVLEIKHLKCLVLTRVSVGSGLIQTDEIQVVNFRMLKKALKDCRGNLLDTSTKLSSGYYYPKVGVHFSYIHGLTENIGGVKLEYEGHRVLKEFSLGTPDDSKVIINGLEMNPTKFPHIQHIHLGNGKYAVMPSLGSPAKRHRKKNSKKKKHKGK